VTDLPAGTYAYFAVATDGIGRMATSTVATVTVTNPAPNVPPTVSLTSPTNQATFCACTIIPLVAVAEDGDGEVVSVGFYDGATPLALLSVPPYRWSVTNLAGGAHSLTARATDNRGATRTSAVVNITIPPPPANTLVATLTLRGEFEGCFAGLAGTNYILTRVTNLSFPGPWSQVATRLVTNASPTGVLRFVDPSSTNLPRTYFYRVEQWR
jgi:chitinase